MTHQAVTPHQLEVSIFSHTAMITLETIEMGLNRVAFESQTGEQMAVGWVKCLFIMLNLLVKSGIPLSLTSVKLSFWNTGTS